MPLNLKMMLSLVGYEVYLVGGCVRDLILKRIPKDFDVITSAELKEVSPSDSCALFIKLILSFILGRDHFYSCDFCKL